MNCGQRHAFKALERALAQCAEEGLRIFGMDTNLWVYSRADLEATGHDPDSYEARVAADHIAVQDSGAYRDSGGW